MQNPKKIPEPVLSSVAADGKGATRAAPRGYDQRTCAACRVPVSGEEFECADCWSARYCSAVHRAAHRAGKHARECEALGAATLAHLRERVEKGEVQAIMQLGSAYDNAFLRLAKDVSAAVSWFERAAVLGHAQAQFNLGCAYRDGIGVEQDHAEALRRFREAAEQGLAEAQCAIGQAYYSGLGVAVNFERAVKYSRLGAQGGHALSMYCLGVSYLQGEGVPRSLPIARAWLLSSRRLGYDAAKASVALAAVDAAEAKASVGVGGTCASGA